MKLSRILDIGLLAAALLLGGYLFFTRESPTQAEFEARRSNLLPAFRPEDISRLRVTIERDSPSLVLRRAAEDDLGRAYLLGETGQRRAEESAVDAFLSSLDFSTWERVLPLPKEEELTRFGLRDPKAEILIEAGARSYRILIGGSAAHPPGAHYVSVSDNNVDSTFGVVDAEVTSHLMVDEQQFESRLVLPLSRRETNKLTLTNQSGTVVLDADDLGFRVAPRVPGGPALRADRALSDVIFYQLARAKFESYVDIADGKKAVASTPDSVTVRQEGPNHAAYAASFGGPCEGELLTRVYRSEPTPAAGCTSSSVVAAFRLDRDRLIDRTPAPLRPDEIDHVIVEFDGARVDLIRKDAEYALLSDKGRIISRETGDELIEILADAKLTLENDHEWTQARGTISIRGQSPLTAASPPPPPASPGLVPTLDGVRDVRLEVEKDDRTGDVFVRRLDDGAILRVPPELHWAFLADDSWAREKKLTDFSREDLVALSVALPGGEPTTLVRDANGFQMTPAEGRTADVGLVRDLLDQLVDLTAVRFVSPAIPRPRTGLLTISFDVRRGDEAIRESLWIGERTRGGHLAWSTVTKGTFVVSIPARLVFETPLLDRSPARLRPEDLDSLRIVDGDRKYSFVREAGLLRSDGGAATDDMVAPLEDALRSIEIAAVMPESTASELPKRSGSPLIISGMRNAAAGKTPFEFRIGGIGVFQGESMVAGWFAGESRTYLIRATSLSPLKELL